MLTFGSYKNNYGKKRDLRKKQSTKTYLKQGAENNWLDPIFKRV